MFKLNLFLIFIFITAQASSQKTYITGFLRDSITHYPIANGTINNSGSKKKVLSDTRGFFRLEASPNDLIYALAASYSYDTLRYSLLFKDTVIIFLSPKGDILPNVTVRSRYTKYQLDSMERKASFEEMRGHAMNAVSSAPASGFGINLNLDRIFKKKYRNKKRDEQMFKKTEEMAYINYRFSHYFVAYYTGLKGDALRNFMYRYTPSYKWLRQHNSNEDLVYYVNEKLKVYKTAISN